MMTSPPRIGTKVSAAALALRLLLAGFLLVGLPRHLQAQESELGLAQLPVERRETLATQPPPPPGGRTESLPDLLRRVLPYDPQVRSARALLEAAIERRKQARSRLGPTAGVTVTQGNGAETDYGVPVNRRTDRAEAVLRWNLYNAGNDSAELRATAAEERAAEQDLRRAQEEVVQRVAEAYLDVLRLQGLLPRAAERLSDVQRLVQRARRQNQLGKLSDSDVQQAEASLLDAEIVHQSLLADHESARQKLSNLVGADSVDELRPLQPVDLRLSFTAGVADAASSSDQVSAPGAVTAAQERAVAARERVRPSVSLLAPRVDLELHKQLSDRTTPVSSTEQQRAWMIVARWELPVGGELQSRRNETERRAEAAEAEAQRLARGVNAERSSLAPQLAQAERAVALLDKQIEQFHVLVRAGDLQFEAGRRSLAQLIQLLDSRFNAEQRRAEQAGRFHKLMLTQRSLRGELLSAPGLVEAQVNLLQNAPKNGDIRLSAGEQR
jgi:outer membrane protein TolC